MKNTRGDLKALNVLRKSLVSPFYKQVSFPFVAGAVSHNNMNVFMHTRLSQKIRRWYGCV